MVFLKFGVSNWIYGGEPLETTMERLSRNKYDGIEIMGEPTEINIEKTKELLKSYKLRAPSVAGIWPAGRVLISANEKIRKSTIRYVKDCVKMIAELDGHIFSGYIPSSVMNLQPMASEEKEWQLAIKVTRDITKYALDFDVKLGIEPINRFETYLINRADQALKLLEDVNMDNVGITLDLFHLNIEEASTIDAIKKVGKHLINFHVADNNRMPPGQGHLDWKGITNALKEIKYGGYMIMEYLPPIDRTPLKSKYYDTRKMTGSVGEFLSTHGTAIMTKEYYDRSAKNAIEFLKKFL